MKQGDSTLCLTMNEPSNDLLHALYLKVHFIQFFL